MYIIKENDYFVKNISWLLICFSSDYDMNFVK